MRLRQKLAARIDPSGQADASGCAAMNVAPRLDESSGRYVAEELKKIV